MSAAPASSSEAFRQNGNAHYGRAKAAAAGSPEKRRHLWSALDCYKEGLAAAAVPRDRSLCCKNTAVTHTELALMEWALGNKVRAWDHIHNSLAAYSQAWLYSTAWTGDERRQWSAKFERQLCTDLKAMYSLTLNSATDQILVDNLAKVSQVIGRYDFINTEYIELAANVFVDYANRLLHLSVSLDKKLHHAQAYKFIAQMHFPIKEAERLLKRNATAFACFERELETLCEDQRIQEAVFHSRVELESGKAFLQNIGEHGGEKMNEEVLLGMDHLRGALTLISADGLDIVLEAEVCSSIGNLYLSFFRAESSAEKYFKRSLELVLCHLTTDRQVGIRSESWYTAAERGLRKLQELQAKRRDDERRKELEADGTLGEIKANYFKGIEHFLEYIYAKHPADGAAPPLSADDKPASLDTGKPLKKRLIVALSHYHPDKVKDKQNRRRYYIFEEITKFLNVQFELTK